MQTIDYILLAILALFAWSGFWAGLFATAGRFLGLFIGAAIASRYYVVLAPDWMWLVFDNQTLTEIVLFIVIFTLVSRGVGLVFWIIDKLFNVVSFFPFLTTINRLLGAILGLLEGTLYVGLVLFVLTKYPISDRLMEFMNTSIVADTLLAMTFIIQPFLAAAFRDLPIVDIFK